MRDFHELTYLRELNAKHGRYMKQYFGFSIADIASRIGINLRELYNIVHGRRNMPEKYVERFIQVFKELGIEEKNVNFQPSADQLWLRAWNEKMKRNLLTISALCFTIITMRAMPLFLKSSAVSFLEYIRRKPSENQLCVKPFRAVFEKTSSAARFFLNLFATKSLFATNPISI